MLSKFVLRLFIWIDGYYITVMCQVPFCPHCDLTVHTVALRNTCRKLSERSVDMKCLLLTWRRVSLLHFLERGSEVTIKVTKLCCYGHFHKPSLVKVCLVSTGLLEPTAYNTKHANVYYGSTTWSNIWSFSQRERERGRANDSPSKKTERVSASEQGV